MSSRIQLTPLLAALVVIVNVIQAGAAATPASDRGPIGQDGRPLNLDFEDGTLGDWTASGTLLTSSRPRRHRLETARRHAEAIIEANIGSADTNWLATTRKAR
jgi:hypothetical protein